MRYALIIALVVICVIGVAGVAYFAGRVYDTPDPLAAQKLELDKLTLTARIERLRIEREAEKRKTAVTLATLTRQRRIAAARPVVSVISRHVIKDEVEEGRLFEARIKNFKIKRKFYIAYSKERKHDAFIDNVVTYLLGLKL